MRIMIGGYLQGWGGHRDPDETVQPYAGKVTGVLPLYPVTIIYPIPYEKWLIWIDEDSGELSKNGNHRKKAAPIRLLRNYIRSKCS